MQDQADAALESIVNRCKKIMSPGLRWEERSDEIGIFVRRAPKEILRMVKYIEELRSHIDELGKLHAALCEENMRLRQQGSVIEAGLRQKTPVANVAARDPARSPTRAPTRMPPALPNTDDLPRVEDSDIFQEVSKIYEQLEVVRPTTANLKDPRREQA